MGSSASAPASAPTKLEDKYYPEPGLWGPWWNFQRFLEFSPRTPGGMIQFDEHIVQIGLVPASTSMFFLWISMICARFVTTRWNVMNAGKKKVCGLWRVLLFSTPNFSEIKWKGNQPWKGIMCIFIYACILECTYIDIILYHILYMYYCIHSQSRLKRLYIYIFRYIAGYIDVANSGRFNNKSNTGSCKFDNV